MKKENNRFSKLFIIAFIMIFQNACNNNDMIVDIDNVDIVELNEENSDIKIFPIKCSFPIDEIYRSIGYNDYTFLLNMSWKTIYCIQNDTVISTLNSAGRGRGEYSYINDFAYSEEDQTLYVQGDGKLFKYEVPSMTFIESIDLSVTATGMIILNSDEILMKCSYTENDELYRGICVVSSKTGKVIKKISDFSYINTQWFMQRDLSTCADGVVFPINNIRKNSLMIYNLGSEDLSELFSFSYNSRWNVSRKLERLAKKDPMKFSYENESNTLHCEGCHYPTIVNSKLMFWSFPREKDNVKSIVSIIRDGEVINRSFVISGTELNPSPYHINGEYCVDIISSISDLEITDSCNLSPLGLELNRRMKSQPFENPILLYFSVDKGL